MRSDRGQIVLILVLITVVGLTIGLSLVSRTITDIRISSQIEQSSRAFSAAEAGIETALRGNIEVGPTGTVALGGGASANYSVQTFGGTNEEFNVPLTQVGNSQTVWLIDHDSENAIDYTGNSYPVSSTLEICFNNLNNNPAILVSIFYQDGNEYKIAKKAYDSIVRGNNLVISDTIGNYCGGKYKNRIVIVPETDFGINPAAKLLFIRFQPLYEATAFTIIPQSDLPIQGKIITSIGQTGSNVVRKIQVVQSYPILPSLLDFSFFSEN